MFDKVIIVDQSATLPETPGILSPDRPRAFIPIFSNRGYGRDSEIKLFEGNSQNSLIRNYGRPDLTTTLAPLYYAYEFLRGGGDVYVRRIVSDTSTHAHAVIVAKHKEDNDVAEITFEIQVIENSTDIDSLLTNAEALLNATPDLDGFTSYPIAVVGLKWKGAEGNKFTFRLLPNTSIEEVIDQRGYSLEIHESGVATPTTIEFSTHPDAMLDNTSIYANDYFDETSPNVFFKMLNTYDAFLELIEGNLPPGEEYPDIFFGKAKDGTAYSNYEVTEESTDFTSVGGIALSEGSDGTFAMDQAQREDSMMEELAESFLEDETAILENEYKYYVDYVFDFGAIQDVKDALVGFVGRRKSTTAIIDTGSEKTKSGILNMRTSGSLTYDNMNVTIVGGVGSVRDPFTNKKITMPLSFFEAYAIPNHIISYESGARPFAGNLYRYTNMLPGSYQPYFYNEDDDMVKQLVNNRVNFGFEDNSSYTAFHQSTALKMNSALAERNNVHLLHLIIRASLLTAKSERWNFAEDSDIEKYQEALNTRVGIEMEGLLGEFELIAEREGTIGPARNRVAVTATIRFRYINKGTSFRFIVV